MVANSKALTHKSKTEEHPLMSHFTGLMPGIKKTLFHSSEALHKIKMDVVEKLNHYFDIEERLVRWSCYQHHSRGHPELLQTIYYVVSSAENMPLGESDDFGTFVQIGGCNRK